MAPPQPDSGRLRGRRRDRGTPIHSGPRSAIPRHHDVTEIHWNIDLLALVAGVCGAAIAIVATRLVFLSEDAFSRLPFH